MPHINLDGAAVAKLLAETWQNSPEARSDDDDETWAPFFLGFLKEILDEEDDPMLERALYTLLKSRVSAKLSTEPARIQRVLDASPTEPRKHLGLPNDLAYSNGWHDAWDMVKDLLREDYK